jgi:hypothetical protein
MELILLTCENNRTSSVVWISALFDIDSSASRPTISQARANSVLNSEHDPPAIGRISGRQHPSAKSIGGRATLAGHRTLNAACPDLDQAYGSGRD